MALHVKHFRMFEVPGTKNQTLIVQSQMPCQRYVHYNRDHPQTIIMVMIFLAVNYSKRAVDIGLAAVE